RATKSCARFGAVYEISGLSHNHQTAHPHLKSDIFSDPVIYANSLHNLEKDIKRSKEDFIRHLFDKYSDSLPPVWAVVELLTMGQLSKWFGNIKYRHDRQSISRIYGQDEKVMSSFCEHLSLVRNHAAHHARLWNRDFTKTPMLPQRRIHNWSAVWLLSPNMTGSSESYTTPL
uniref:Abi family protein n=1 Tax=Endozoicomonas sp. ONNA2 TaxID=2828741 RepID=UPI0021473D7F